ncbi:tRNA (adenosine(37)-N6)-threonylcarbamoyltransferase complex dimerization subunit type 1 TsaB [Sphingobacterium sp. SRCM116780]|uniref:tRNA (adenosine(37)-N6)-threonylcarbamoyltransferase complex dimerization subunit type 1 TsaB n=1 Tax=Sphingobacterium sp. SRCM116780 TaxID=2907623 RepID=UPI001F3197BC|nr:tRNA (adenosine(37)-N6)-threonylcarbamoyltransferase complex dimerization subunit type 1 TsaB [Sphingobacterium sp. SRCM116780]UIR56487.1 tRNA (adenosine(37)-N6)-threonylcarbamoyltransferase complex dimerization subunit type 1 TsaB [Sphingobacterium sp. SRCM116780]
MHTYILQIETSTSVCSVALVESERVCQSESLNEPNVHASQLTILIQDLLDLEHIGFGELSAVAVSMGPGSYTGLRIGVSTAKGLCYALDIPLIAVNTLDGLYEGFKTDRKESALYDLYIPMLDARRMEVYCAAFDKTGDLVSNTAALIIDETSFDQYRDHYPRICLFGPGADKLEALFVNTKGITIVPGIQTNAVAISRSVFQKYQMKDFEDIAYFEPYYLKDFVATVAKKSPSL